MAETVVSLAGQHVLPRFLEVVNMLRGLKKEVEDIKKELESFQHFINDADKVAEAEQDDGKHITNKKKRVKRLREAAFSMENIIDLYDIYEDKQPGDPGCAALPCEAVDYIKTLIFWLQIELKENYGLQSKLPLEQRPISSTGNQNVTRHNLRMAPLYAEEAEVVGFDDPRDILKDWLIEGRVELTVIFVVGMGELGKTTLAKLVYDNMEHGSVSKSYTAEGLLREMLDMLCNEKVEDPAPNFETLTRKLRNGLCNKGYVVVFDDVWNKRFWNDIQFALIDNKNGSRILITTQDTQVAQFCMKDSLIQLKLEPLSEEKSLELFCKKAFGYGFDGRYPKEYKDLGLEIIGKGQCLPLAIVAIGGLLYSKCKSAAEWKRFSQNLSLELERNSELSSISQILCLSYDDLPYNLRSCLLYFGMYPEDYDGFVKHVTGETLEEVAQQYLAELINRSLVQVSSFTINGKVRGCCVHDSIHEMILRKIKDTVFCHCIHEHNQLVSSGILRHLTIATGSTDLIGSIERSHVRTKDLSENFISKILAKYMLLRVLDLEYAGLSHLPENLGNLIHLKYLSLRYTQFSKFTNDPLKSLTDMPNLLFLCLDSHAYEGQTLHFQKGGFQKLKELELKHVPHISIFDLVTVQRLEEFLLDERKHRLVDLVVRNNSFEKTVVVALSGGGIVILDEVFEILPLIQLEPSASKLQFPI
ncbi:Disease resistance protein RPM1 [Glycine soja]|uniref:Disease resistance protein RPM1 n=1 Tax=Glycine soja TaxID=3848 RepID=A0A445M392_GLYSO|nr:Disease resistance protein RPM1 [Glycine soja]